MAKTGMFPKLVSVPVETLLLPTTMSPLAVEAKGNLASMENRPPKNAFSIPGTNRFTVELLGPNPTLENMS